MLHEAVTVHVTETGWFVPFRGNNLIAVYYDILLASCGPGSSVGVATGYGLDGPGSNPGRDEIFRQSRPALGPTEPPVKWVPDLSPG